MNWGPLSGREYFPVVMHAVEINSEFRILANVYTFAWEHREFFFVDFTESVIFSAVALRGILWVIMHGMSTRAASRTSAATVVVVVVFCFFVCLFCLFVCSFSFAGSG